MGKNQADLGSRTEPNDPGSRHVSSAPAPASAKMSSQAASTPAAPSSRPAHRSRLDGSLLFAAGIHLLGLFVLIAWAIFSPKPPPVVATFELVSAERPKLRPVAPKTPEPPPEKPVESRPPPTPTPVPTPQPKPKPPKAPAKPEPKVVRPAPADTSLPVKDIAPENANLTTTLVANIPSDPRLAFWAGRVKKQVERLWNPPAGIEVANTAKSIISFQVARSGVIGNVEVVESSGNTLLDDMAKTTILRLAHVPPIPENFPGDFLKVSYEFIYNGN